MEALRCRMAHAEMVLLPPFPCGLGAARRAGWTPVLCSSVESGRVGVRMVQLQEKARQPLQGAQCPLGAFLVQPFMVDTQLCLTLLRQLRWPCGSSPSQLCDASYCLISTSGSILACIPGQTTLGTV